MMRRSRSVLSALATVSLLSLAFVAVAQTSQNGGSSPESIRNQLSNSIDQSPLVEPTVRPNSRSSSGGEGGDITFQPDAAILGIAPGGKRPMLRREGEFLVNRRGRLVRGGGTGGGVGGGGETFLFAFEADGQDSPEQPMHMLPCQLLESMEGLVRERGDKVVFQISGQIFTYRGANYLLPSMMKLSIDRGNLQR